MSPLIYAALVALLLLAVVAGGSRAKTRDVSFNVLTRRVAPTSCRVDCSRLPLYTRLAIIISDCLDTDA